MADLPSNVSFGTVIGRFIRAVADTADADRDPDMLPVTGTITFSPDFEHHTRDVTALPVPVTIFADSITCTIDSDGYLLGPDGQRGVKLVASDDPDLDPTSFTYSVVLSFVGYPDYKFSILVPADSTVDLTTVIPSTPSDGLVVGADSAMAAIAADPNSQFAQQLSSTIATLKQWARNPDVLIAGAVTRDTNGAATSAPVVWPDGTPGAYTALTLSTAFPGAVDSYKVTYGSPVVKTFTQSAITRDSNGAPTNVPQIVVS